jgi:hypothetical protein
VLKLGAVDEQELYEALDWLRGEQGRIEQALARRHLRNGMLVLYDVTSTYFEGRTCPLAKLLSHGFLSFLPPQRASLVCAPRKRSDIPGSGEVFSYTLLSDNSARNLNAR